MSTIAEPGLTANRTTDGKYTLLSDQRHTDPGDPLGFDQIALQISRMILDSRSSSPFTLGIEGGWGTGKSSLMCRIDQQLATKPGVKTVWFDAWTADEGQALESVIKSALAKLDRNVLRRLARMRRLSGWARLGTTLLGGWLRVGPLVDRIWDQLAVDPTARNELQDLLEREMRAWMEGDPGVSEGRLLVMFVDDLDRCSPTNVFQIFEAIKLYLNTCGFVFVVGFDKTVVSDAVLRHKQYSSTIKSADYLEKIIQVTYRMPRPSEDSALGLMDAYLAQAGTHDLFGDPSLKSLVLARSDTNPRRIKRFINSFILEYSLDREWQEEFTAGDVVRVVVLYMYFPTFAELLHAPGDDDPIQMFLEYIEVRQILNRRPSADDVAWALVDQFSNAYGLPRAEPSRGGEHISEEIDTGLPSCFPQLAKHREFAELLRALGDANDRNRLRAKLQSRRPAVIVDSPATSLSGGEAAGTEIGFRPLPEPVGPFPYRLSLTDHLDAQDAERLSDTQTLTFHVAGSTGGVKDPGPQHAVATAMAADARSAGAAFFYHLGDVVYFEGREADYPAQFDEPYADYPGPIFAIPGNHDGGGDEEPPFAGFRSRFCAPESSRLGAEEATHRVMGQPNLYWTLDAKVLRIIGLCTNVSESGQVDGDQIRWLIDELVNTPTDCQVVVALHHDPYSASAPSGSSRMATMLDDAFRTAGRVPDMVLSAHVHAYQRFSRSFGDKTVPYIVAGAGGYFRLRAVRASTMPFPVAADCVLRRYVDRVHGFLRLTLTDSGLEGEYIGVGKDGSTEAMDHFKLDRTPSLAGHKV